MVNTHPPYPSNPGNPINKYKIDWCLTDGNETKNKQVKKRRKNAKWMNEWMNISVKSKRSKESNLFVEKV